MPESTQYEDIIIEDDKNRLFSTWVSVADVKDTQGDIIPLEKLKTVLPTMLRRRTPITIMHTNKIVGEMIGGQFGIHPKFNKEGLKIIGRIFDDYEKDNEAWDGLKTGKFKGTSLGGRQKAISGTHGELEYVEPCEIALADVPSNPGAEVLATSMAKAANCGNNEPQDMAKPFAGYENFAACVSANKDKEDPDAYCATIMRSVEGDMKKQNVTFEEKGTETSKKKESSQIYTGDNLPVDSKSEEKKDTPKIEEKKETPKEEPKVEELKKETPTVEEHPDENTDKLILDKLTENNAISQKILEMLSQVIQVAGTNPSTMDMQKATSAAPVKQAITAEKISDTSASVTDLQKSATTTEVPRPATGGQFNPETGGSDYKEQNKKADANLAIKIAKGEHRPKPIDFVKVNTQ